MKTIHWQWQLTVLINVQSVHKDIMYQRMPTKWTVFRISWKILAAAIFKPSYTLKMQSQIQPIRMGIRWRKEKFSIVSILIFLAHCQYWKTERLRFGSAAEFDIIYFWLTESKWKFRLLSQWLLHNAILVLCGAHFQYLISRDGRFCTLNYCQFFFWINTKGHLRGWSKSL